MEVDKEFDENKIWQQSFKMILQKSVSHFFTKKLRDLLYPNYWLNCNFWSSWSKIKNVWLQCDSIFTPLWLYFEQCNLIFMQMLFNFPSSVTQFWPVWLNLGFSVTQYLLQCWLYGCRCVLILTNNTQCGFILNSVS
jgi:hypothetical protein